MNTASESLLRSERVDRVSQPLRGELEIRGRLLAAVNDRLSSSGYYNLRRLSCRVDGNVVRLAGRVSSYHEKQVAQALVLKQLSAEMVLANQLEVIGV